MNVAEYFELAAAKVDPAVWCYFEGGAGDEVTLRANVGAYARWRFRPRVLVDVGEVSTRTTVLGTPVSMPLRCEVYVDGGIRRGADVLKADEIELGLALLGCGSPAEVTRSHICPTVPYDPAA